MARGKLEGRDCTRSEVSPAQETHLRCTHGAHEATRDDVIRGQQGLESLGLGFKKRTRHMTKGGE